MPLKQKSMYMSHHWEPNVIGVASERFHYLGAWHRMVHWPNTTAPEAICGKPI